MDNLLPQAICHYPFGQVICGWLFRVCQPTDAPCVNTNNRWKNIVSGKGGIRRYGDRLTKEGGRTTLKGEGYSPEREG